MPAILFLVLPLFALLAYPSKQSIWQTLRQPESLDAMWLSARTTLIATVCVVVFGFPFALLLRRRRFFGSSVLDALIELPILLPPSVAGIGLLLAFGRNGMVGGWLSDHGIEVAFSTIAVVMAQSFVAMPFFLRTAVVALRGIDRDLEEAASLDGATKFQALTQVSLKLAGPAFAAGALMAWARALGEFGATILFAGNMPGRTQTMPLAIYIGFETDLDRGIALSVVLLIVAGVVLASVRTALGRIASGRP